MPAIWTAPRTWSAGEAVTASLLNQQMRDNLTYLYERPYDLIELRGQTSKTLTGLTTTPTAIDDTITTLELETTGRPVRLSCNFQFTMSVNSLIWVYDWLIDGTTYASSGTGTPLARGSFAWNNLTIATGVFAFDKIVQGLTAGVHTFRPRVWVTTSTGNLTVVLTNGFAELSAQEI